MKLFPTVVYLAALALLAGCAGDRFHREGLSQFADGKAEAGVANLENAVRAEPDNIVFRRDLLKKKSEIIAKWLSDGEKARKDGHSDAADAAYRRVIAIEPSNSRAQAGLAETERDRRHAVLLEQARTAIKAADFESAATLLRMVLTENPGSEEGLALRRQIDARGTPAAATVRVIRGKPINLEFRDTSLKVVLDALTRASGIDFVLDKEVRPDLRTTVVLRQASFDDALDIILQTSRLEKKILNRSTVMIYPGTPEKLKEYQDLVVKGFYLANADVKQTQALIKSMLKTKDTFIDEKINLLVIRDTPEAIKLAEKLIAMQDLPESEVMLEVEVLEVKRSRLLDLGIQWPSQLSVTPLVATPASIASLRGLNATRLGVTVPTATVNMLHQVGDANILANPSIRARNREKAKIMIGDKVPVTTNMTTATGVISESVQYLDVGIKLEVEPNIYLDDDVAIRVGLEVSSLVREIRTPGGSLAYQIGSRAANTVLRLKDGETQVLAGLISDEDRHDASRVPGLGDLPILSRLFGSQKDDRQKTEIVLSITPHLIRNINRPDAAASEFWSGTELAIRARAPGSETLALPTTTDVVEPRNAGPDLGGKNAPTAISLAWQGPAQVKVGEPFKVMLKMNSDGGVRSLPFQLGFDPAAVQVIEISEGAYFKANEGQTSMSSNIDPSGGKAFVSVVRANVDGVRGDTDVAVLTLRALTSKPSELRLLSTSPIAVGGASITPAMPAPFVVNVAQ